MKDARLAVAIDKKTREKLKKILEKEGRTISSWVRMLVERKIKDDI